MKMLVSEKEYEDDLQGSKKLQSFSLRNVKFETITLELFLCTVLASFFESMMDRELSFTLDGLLFFLISILVNVLLIEVAFRFIKVIKNGKNEKS